MDTKPLEKFSQAARRQLHEQVAAKLERVLRTDSAELRAQAAAIAELKKQIAATSRQAVIERVAYTWFNRFCALRFMDVRGYTRMGAVSPAPGFTQPEILQEAKQGIIDPDLDPFVKRQTVFDLLAGRAPSRDPQAEAYRLLLVAVCNSWHDAMPFLFERIDDYTELLMPDDLLSAGSILQGVRDAMTPERCQDVEIIGWLYQFYISEKKDQVIGSKQKIKAEDIPAATQLFTPHWIVRFLVENSLGRLWMLNHPESKLAERMDYYISDQSSVESDQSGTDNWSLTTDYLKIRSPEELLIADPAAGSGHMLTYAFDLLHAIYEEQGYNPREIPRLILEKNLTGMEIDERAGALAAFALTMKARETDSRFFRRAVRPNVVVLRPIQFGDDELRPLLEGMVDALVAHGKARKEARPQLREALLHDLHLWAEADNFGSLLRPQLSAGQIAAVHAQVVGTATGPQADWLAQDLRGRVLRTLEQAEVLARKYHVVVANPPYMGSLNMNVSLSTFAGRNYPDTKADLFAMFITRNLDMALRQGIVAMITMQNWMFLSSFEGLRRTLLARQTIVSMAHLGPRAFDTISGEVVSATAFVVETMPQPTYKGTFLRLTNEGSEAEKEATLRSSIVQSHVKAPNLFLASAIDFKAIPGSPIVYWIGETMRNAFVMYKSIGDIASPRAGLATGDNPTFQRAWYETSLSNIAFDCQSTKESEIRPEKWYPCNSGGPFRKWYGNNETVVNWQFDGRVLRNFRDQSGRLRSRPQNTQYYFLPGITWTKLSSATFAARIREPGFVFDDTGRSAFPEKEEFLKPLLAVLCSRIASAILPILNPSLSFTSGDIKKVPVSEDILSVANVNVIDYIVNLSREDWNSYEYSWSFSLFPLTEAASYESDLAATYCEVRAKWLAMTLETQRLEQDNNHLLIEAYGLQDELTPEVPLSEITLTCNPWYRYGGQVSVDSDQWAVISNQWPEVAQHLAQIAGEMAPDEPEEARLGLEQRLLADTVRELASYAVGCMFGRYSLDKPGLILGNQGETVADYVRKVGEQSSVSSDQSSVVGSKEDGSLMTDHRSLITFPPDRDNAIPILDGDWFEDDIVGRFRQFLRVAFGEEHFADNLAFVEAALGRDLRSFFLREFYDDHLKRYKKRPIYWLFSSPQSSFNVLIYMHRYRPDTVSVVLNGYLREFQAKLRARRAHLERISVSGAASARDKTNALKEIDRIDKTLVELTEYEDEVLYPLATRRLEIDLDDGVKVNYAKFGAALKAVKGLSN